MNYGHDVLVLFFVLQNQGRAIMAGDAAEGPKDFAGMQLYFADRP